MLISTMLQHFFVSLFRLLTTCIFSHQIKVLEDNDPLASVANMLYQEFETLHILSYNYLQEEENHTII